MCLLHIVNSCFVCVCPSLSHSNDQPPQSVLEKAFHGQFDVPRTHVTLLPAQNSLNWIRIKYLRWFRKNREIIVTRGNNASIISVTLKSRYSAWVGQQVNEGCNGINTHGVECPRGQKQGCCIIRALLTPGQYTRTACFTWCLNKGQIVLSLCSHPGGGSFE